MLVCLECTLTRLSRDISVLVHQPVASLQVASRSHDYSDLRASGGPAMTTTQRTPALIAYQLPRLPTTAVTSQPDLR